MSQETIMLIDGNSLVHRAFHAIPPLSTSAGLPTNAVYGFTSMLLKLLAKERPGRIAVAFDIGKKTFRHNDYNQYKAHRSPTPGDLQRQFSVVKEVLHAMRINIFESEGYEADDLIGTLSAKAELTGLNTLIITGDRDILQLISPTTRVMLTKKGISEIDEYDEGKFWDKYGITPRQLVDLKGMTGDPSDNVPGITGIGEKTAVRLLREYGSLAEIIAHADELTGRTGQLFKESGQQAEFSKQLVTIRRDVPVEVNLEQCRWVGPDYKELLELLKKLEFNKLIKSIYFADNDGKGDNELRGRNRSRQNAAQVLPKSNLETYSVACRSLDNPSTLSTFLKKVRMAGQVSMALAGNPNSGVAAAGFAIAGDTAYFLNMSGAAVAPEKAFETLKTVCEDSTIKKYCHNGKDIIKILHCHNFKLRNLAFDTMIASYLLNPAIPNRELENVSLEYLNVILPGGDEALPARADCVNRLAGILNDKLKLQEQDRLFYDVELPLAQVLGEMEINGVAVDKIQLESMSKTLGELIEELAGEIYNLAGCKFNINSSKQLGKILFDDLKLPVIKKTKTGYSTDAGVLEELAAAHSLVAKVLEYRQLMKLKSTYTDGLAALINPDTGRLHTSFHQTVTATGRLSSSDPNLQNIPIRLEQGRLIRKVFIPCRGENLLLTADYSQIELRILAHISGDPVLIEAFKKGEDIHTRTAAEIFLIPPEEVTRETRRRAKAVNFGIVYGLSDFGLARDIKVGRQEARQYIENYFSRYAGVKCYIDRVIKEARETGFVTTLLNRRRYLPDLFSSNRNIRHAGERTAVNTPIQGSAADIIKLAMININREITEHGLKARMILQVHDELIFDTPREEVAQLKQLVKRCMENAFVLDVPLDVVIKVGPNWYDVK
ncbi:DNA polymerase I [Pelotomaculum terephthalicicum JT]|uniref:DNA polymerase I n=1 Tax=Pelotomaculum TaxID=191373 RepID=UPI0009C92774|nr:MULTISPECIES: DNA polymerase I [Pelotomaculum]MCG9969381.1 DNA polymerase I [Pelotomaculum terephthalicicum JT]OPX87600.1 MAG: DNA polymerase I [Pelotomaculum sp. PtaB.Bin117]OPY60668.1 MAG: DNA polymerase I [Pelotomaculum sp. PtaU1.Bin065]